MPASRAEREADGTGGLAHRRAPADVHDRPDPGPARPQDDQRFCGESAVDGPAEAAAAPDGLRYPSGRSRRLERLEGADFEDALLRDRRSEKPKYELTSLMRTSNAV